MADRPTCCWTHCENEQGAGTWTEINGETLPVCEDHWYGNWTKKVRQLGDENARLRRRLDFIGSLATGEEEGR